MLNRIRKLIPPQAMLEPGSMRFLWLEITLFSGIYGLLLHSWVGFGSIFLGLAWLLKRSRGPVYTIYAISLMWAVIFISVGYLLGGWIGSVLLTVFVFFKGVDKHMSGLHWVRKAAEPQAWAWRGHNLN